MKAKQQPDSQRASRFLNEWFYCSFIKLCRLITIYKSKRFCNDGTV